MKSLCSEVSPQQIAAGSAPQLRNGFVFDLPHSFTGEVVPFANVFQAKRMVNANPKKEFYHIFLPLSECT